MKRAAHLVSRFFRSLYPRPLDDETVAWVARVLEPDELRVWEGLGRADRAESVEVARRFEAVSPSGPDASPGPWTAAALLHDVGKQASGYGPIGRALVTVIAVGAGTGRVRGWVTAPGSTRSRMGRYVAHDEIGAEMLRRAGSRPEAVAWAGAHHHPPLWAATGIPAGVCRALAVADGEPGA